MLISEIKNKKTIPELHSETLPFYKEPPIPILGTHKRNINNASFNAIEEIKESYALQGIAVNSNYKLSDLKEIHRDVKDLDKVKVIVEQAERFNLELHDVVSIINAVNK